MDEGSPDRSRRRPSSLRLAIVLSVVALCATVSAEPAAAPLPVMLTVDFGDVVAEVPPGHIGFTATTFGGDDGTVVDQPATIAALRALGAGTVRIHLSVTSEGRVVTGAGGGDQAVSADRWLDAYAGIGLSPVVVLDLDPDEAVAVLRDLRTNGHDVRRFVLGNEFDVNSRADVSEEEYVRRFRATAAAMRTVDPGLEIGGPASAHFEGLTDELVLGLLEAPPAERASFIDYHAYGAGEGVTADAGSAWRYGEQVHALRERLEAFPGVGIQVGEFNLNWTSDSRNESQFHTVWVAVALGTILSAGAVAIQYGDQHGAMGLVAGGAPRASYWGMAMITGAGVFRPFGSRAVRTTTSDPAVRVVASVDGENIVIANTGPPTRASLVLSGATGVRAGVWRSTDGAPLRLPDRHVGAVVELALPGTSVTTLVLDAG